MSFIFGSVGQLALRIASTHWNVPGKYGPHGELFFFLLKKEPMVLGELIECKPCTSAERVNACAFIDWHMMAEEMPFGRTGTLLPIWETCGRYGCPKKPCVKWRRV